MRCHGSHGDQVCGSSGCSEVGQEVQVDVTGVSGVDACVAVVGEVRSDMQCPTGLLRKVGELT